MLKWIVLGVFLTVFSQMSVNEVSADLGLSEDDKLWLQGLRDYTNKEGDKRDFSEDSEDEVIICDSDEDCEECVYDCGQNEDCLLSCLYFTKRNTGAPAKQADALEP